MSRSIRKPDFCICENKGADQDCGNHEADLISAFVFATWIVIPLLPSSEISSFLLSSVIVQPSLCRTWSETQIISFLTHRLKYNIDVFISVSPVIIVKDVFWHAYFQKSKITVERREKAERLRQGKLWTPANIGVFKGQGQGHYVYPREQLKC